MAGVRAVALEELGSMPAVGTVNHVPDRELAKEEYVAFHLRVRSYDQLDRRRGSRSAVSPGAALATGVDDASDHVGDRGGTLRCAQDLFHLRARRVPPPYMKLAQFTADLRSISGPQHSEGLSDIEAGPVLGRVPGGSVQHPWLRPRRPRHRVRIRRWNIAAKAARNRLRVLVQDTRGWCRRRLRRWVCYGPAFGGRPICFGADGRPRYTTNRIVAEPGTGLAGVSTATARPPLTHFTVGLVEPAAFAWLPVVVLVLTGPWRIMPAPGALPLDNNCARWYSTLTRDLSVAWVVPVSVAAASRTVGILPGCPAGLGTFSIAVLYLSAGGPHGRRRSRTAGSSSCLGCWTHWSRSLLTFQVLELAQGVRADARARGRKGGLVKDLGG